MIPRQFTEALAQLRYGTLNDELTKELRALTLACQDTGRAGAITLTLAIKPGKGGQLEIVDDIKVKMPKPEKGSSLVYATPEGNWQRNDPRQAELDGIRTVDKETGEIRQIAKG